MALAELNLVYLRLKMGEPMVREKRTGLMSAPQVSRVRITQPPSETPSISYAERYYRRAQEYLEKETLLLAIQELRDAIKLNPNLAKYHTLLAQIYLKQNLPGAAKAHCRQALKLDPNDKKAIAYAKQLKLSVNAPTGVTPAKTQPRRETSRTAKGGLFSRFGRGG